jgi:hypothetical protein
MLVIVEPWGSITTDLRQGRAYSKVTENCNSTSTPLLPPQLNKTRSVVIWTHETLQQLQRNWREKLETQLRRLGMSLSCELSSSPGVQLTMEKKYLGKKKILFVQLIEQEPCLYDKCSPDYSRRDKTDLGSCRIAQKMKEKSGLKGVNPVSPPMVIILPPFPNTPPDNQRINIRWHRVS